MHLEFGESAASIRVRLLVKCGFYTRLYGSLALIIIKNYNLLVCYFVAINMMNKCVRFHVELPSHSRPKFALAIENKFFETTNFV